MSQSLGAWINECTCHLSPDELQLLAGQLDRDLLDFAIGTDDLLDYLDAARRRRDRAHHLRRLHRKKPAVKSLQC